MQISEHALTGELQGVSFEPADHRGVGVVVLGGSSGVVPVERARLLAGLGVTAIALRWFGGAGQDPGICEVPLEIFERATDHLVAQGCRRVAYVGTSKGAEAALSIAAFDPRISIVVAFSPSSVVWANTGPGRNGHGWPPRSSFTWRGKPLPFVPHEAEAVLTVRVWPRARYLKLFERSLETFADRLEMAAIPVERSCARIILVAGGDDHLWPSARFARALSERLAAHGKEATLVIHEQAGHRVLLPGETTPRSAVNEHGGTDEADAELGRAAWAEIVRALNPEGLPLQP